MRDLLADPLISVRRQGREERLNLPVLLAALSAGEIEGFLQLRPHQADPWHVFLVQLAASIQARRPTPDLPMDASYWHDGLLDLANGETSAWQLIVEDTSKPAFLQHPWRPGDEGVFKPKAMTPDELDVLVTAKNHDVKMARMSEATPESWLYALLLLQTTSGYDGKGNYGIVRMNGGYASRPIIVWAESLHPSRRFIAEVKQLIALRQTTCQQYGYRDRGIVLTWLAPWEKSDHQYRITELEPWFIEAARAIRLRLDDKGKIMALGTTSNARQIGPKTLENGDVGDPWIPLNTTDKKKGRSALTLSSEGFTPKRVTELLFQQEFELTALQQPKTGTADGWFIGSCLARGQGSTEGFHRLELPIPAEARWALLDTATRETLGRLAQELLKDAKDVQKTISAVLTLLIKGGPEQADSGRDANKSSARDAIKSWLEQAHRDFGRDWEALFFPTLWRGVDQAHAQVRRDWQQQLIKRAEKIVLSAAERVPMPSNRTWRARARLHGRWRAYLRKEGLLPPSSPHEPETEEINP